MTATIARKRKSSGIAMPIDSLRKALAAVRAAVPSRSPKPILLNVLLANGGITASDLELQVSAEVPYTDAPLLLPFARLQAILGAASGDEVTLTPGDTSCTVSVGGGTWTLPTEDAAEFPQWEPQAVKPICRVPCDQFVRAVKAVAYATDNESSRFALGAVLVEVKDGTVTLVGTDGRRLSSYGIEVDQAVDDSTTLIPARAILTISSIASHSEGAVQLEATSSEVVATIDGTVVTARLVDGRFPKWRDSIPKDRHAKASLVNGAELLAATRQAAIVTSEQSKGVTFAFVENGIHLTAQSAGLLEAGLTASVALDPGFVVEFLRGVDEAEPVEVEAVDAQSAVVLRCGDCTGVIMPLAKD
jgi:DNA polymerase-3 subunit beta